MQRESRNGSDDGADGADGDAAGAHAHIPKEAARSAITVINTDTPVNNDTIPSAGLSNFRCW
jgi:hypothetical protein